MTSVNTWPLPTVAPAAPAVPSVVPSAVPSAAQAAGDLAVEYLGVADALARRFRCPGHDPEDLRQVARLGLLKAAHRYRRGQGHGFVPYAVPTITGEIKRYLRDQSWVVRPPRSVQELRLKVNRLRPGLTQSLGHEPSTRELSVQLDLPLADVAEAQLANAAMAADPIEHGDTPEDSGERRLTVVMACEEPGFERVDLHRSLVDALIDATDQDRELLHLRFDEEMTQQEIACELGVSQMQVSRLLRRVLSRLRRRLAA
ncbi:sigma-70 family RNA polymerase sigma factor [Sinomonas sp. JGH33]|uniref:Sigma-70 family RNA polymerase sigma factor n=1 Tax=Sinomonas terricola TaxID=3110330 RepID=A0ABU5TAA1_9MICC|nr:sigma-70 family RNA polymerase sigma factor [Sinomonas sp. JGH33]MEA5456434.1 sigma-70 family RNA polymerase sigma factor [Sinomonas sp. JGH33]